MDELRGLVVQLRIDGLVISIAEVLDQDWYINELLVGIFYEELKKDVGLLRQCL